MNSWKHIFETENEERFRENAIEVFKFQKAHNPVYREYVEMLGRPEPKEIDEIPFLPIDLFKTRKVYCGEKEEEKIFKSSGTGGERSVHYVADISLYEVSFTRAYKQFIGNPEDQVILALLPNYIEQGDSSLVYMVDHLIKLSNNDLSGFLLDEYDLLLERYHAAVRSGKTVIIFGVSYALLDLAAKKVDLSNATIIETGGMKGRRKELTKEELHSELLKGLKPSKLMSEYGMTELLSQAYCDENLRFKCPGWMKVLIRDVNDPLSIIDQGKTGGINIIDLSNIYSCSFIATQDLGKIHDDGFEVLGRFDQADIRGCNLLVQ